MSGRNRARDIHDCDSVSFHRSRNHAFCELSSLRTHFPALLIACAFFEIARVLMRLNHVGRVTMNPNHSAMCPTPKLCVSDCVACFDVPQSAEWQRIGNQIDSAFIFARRTS
jgi:hypothetical protein